MRECRVLNPGHPWVTCERTLERHEGFDHYGFDATVDHYRNWSATPPESATPPVTITVDGVISDNAPDSGPTYIELHRPTPTESEAP